MLKNTVIYTFSSIISALIPFLLMPILTRYLSPSQYGVIAMYTLYLGALGAIIGINVHGSANRRYFDHGVSEFELARYNGNCIYISLLTVIASLFVFFILSYFVDFNNLLGISPKWMLLGIFNALFIFIINLRLGQWQVREKAKTFGVVQIVSSIFNVVISLTFVIFFEMYADGRIIAIALSSFLAMTFCLVTFKTDKIVKLIFNKSDFVSAIKFGYPLIPHVLGGFLIASSDRFILNQYVGLEAVGVYMVAVSLGQAADMVFQSVNKAYSPWLFKKLSSATKTEKLVIVRYTYISFLGVIASFFLVTILIPYFVLIFIGSDFQQVSSILPYILLGQVFNGMYYIVSGYIFYERKTKLLSYVSISSGVINISLLILSVPIYGVYGAAYSFAFSSFIQLILTWCLSAKVHKMPWIKFISC